MALEELAQLPEELAGRIEKSRQRVIETIGKNMDLYGVTLSVGYMYGNMFFRNHPVTLDEMAEVMGLSKTSVSTGMRTLQDLKMIHKVWNRGSRKDLYEVETDWYQTFADYFSIKWRKSVEMNRHALERSLREMNQLLKEHPDNETLVNILRSDIEKIRAAIQYYDWLNRLIDTFESGRIFELVPIETPEEDY
jgi:DNA-binding transcriptional regulator GbsR (MarR family)